MKESILGVVLCILLTPAGVGAEGFLGVPIAPEARVELSQEDRLEAVSPRSHDEILAFYKDALEGEEDIKFRNWKDATYIEDDGGRQWHSITISKEYDEGTEIVIVKDNWTWIIGTLILRYVGVFVVLMVLFLGMSFSGKIISRWYREPAAEKK